MTLSNNACYHIDDPSAISRTHMVKGKTQLVPRPPHMTVACIVPSLKHIEKKFGKCTTKTWKKTMGGNKHVDRYETHRRGGPCIWGFYTKNKTSKQTNRIEK